MWLEMNFRSGQSRRSVVKGPAGDWHIPPRAVEVPCRAHAALPTCADTCRRKGALSGKGGATPMGYRRDHTRHVLNSSPLFTALHDVSSNRGLESARSGSFYYLDPVPKEEVSTGLSATKDLRCKPPVPLPRFKICTVILGSMKKRSGQDPAFNQG